MADHLVLRRLLWALTSVVLVVGLLAVPVVGDDGPDRRDPERWTRLGDGDGDGAGDGGGDEAAGDGGFGAGDAGPGDGSGGEATATTTAEAVAGGPGPGPGAGAGGDPTTTAPPSTTPATFPPAPDDLGLPTDPGPPVAPRPGGYRYRSTGSAAEDGGSGETTTRYEDRGREGDEVRLSVTTTGGELLITTDVVWRPDGVRALRSTFAFGDRRGECDWEPDVQEAVFPLRAGATWTSSSSCGITGATPTPIPVKRTLTAEVVDLRRTRVAGQVVDVWAIRRVERIEGGGMSGETTALALFSPKHGLDVEVTGSGSGGGRSGDYRQELLSLEPEA